MSISINVITTNLALKGGVQIIIFFGWGHRITKEFGPTIALHCPNCKNDGWWHLVSYKTWFTLFFIPVIPYESKHLLLCEICSQGLELKGDQINKAKKLNNSAGLFIEKRISESEYLDSADQIKLLK